MTRGGDPRGLRAQQRAGPLPGLPQAVQVAGVHRLCSTVASGTQLPSQGGLSHCDSHSPSQEGAPFTSLAARTTLAVYDRPTHQEGLLLRSHQCGSSQESTVASGTQLPSQGGLSHCDSHSPSQEGAPFTSLAARTTLAVYDRPTHQEGLLLRSHQCGSSQESTVASGTQLPSQEGGRGVTD